MQALLYKLSTGEEVMAQVAEDSETVIFLRKVRLLQRAPGPQGIIRLILPYWAGSMADELPVQKAHIVFTAEPDKDLVAFYIRETSGIILPGANA